MSLGRVVLASANPKKVAELKAMLVGIDLVPRPEELPDVVEDADTLEGNALLKAEAIGVATGLASIADDTGLEVDALDGAPGVRSARFAGPDHDDAANVDLLLDRLSGVAVEARTARFRTVICFRSADGTTSFVEGVVEGRIVEHRRGTAGFGYDPVFEPLDGDGRTFAEMSSDEKNAISHRGRAVRALRDLLAS